jgi:DNA-binding IclR family transcriptional regulator
MPKPRGNLGARKRWMLDILACAWPDAVSPAAVAREVGATRRSANVQLNELVQRGDVERTGYGAYRLADPEGDAVAGLED